MTPYRGEQIAAAEDDQPGFALNKFDKAEGKQVEAHFVLLKLKGSGKLRLVGKEALAKLENAGDAIGEFCGREDSGLSEADVREVRLWEAREELAATDELLRCEAVPGAEGVSRRIKRSIL